jgi:hypothetical protein
MVTADLLSRARAGDGEAFRELAESLRARHCFRRSQRFSRRAVLAVRSIWPDSGRIGGLRSSP